MPDARPDNFPACLAFTLAQEGGYSDDPRDPGGATNFRITEAALSHWLGIADADVKQLTRDEAAVIYRARYWNACNCAALPIGVDLLVFDFAVNAGPGTSARKLQACADTPIDGMIGPHTIANVTLFAAEDMDGMIGNIEATHAAYYRSLADFPTFGNGWLARLERCTAAALAMTHPAVAGGAA